MYKTITEGKARLLIPKETHVSKKLPVFYNPVMEFNRTISVTLLNCINKKDMQIALPLAGTGVRGIRFLKELKKGKIRNISFNDLNQNFKTLLTKSLRLNKLKPTKDIIIKNIDANEFLLNSTGFDYIDIDPFGTPNPFLQSAILRLARDGVLAVTATDTGCLAGSFPEACKRKYWAVPQRNETMHENGLRILIRKVQLIAAQYDKALLPIYSYSKEHYFRIFFKCDKGSQKVDELLKQHGMFNGAGPLWLGQLWDKDLASKINKALNQKFTKIISEESNTPTVGFYDIHKLSKKHKVHNMAKKEILIKKIRDLGYNACSTHFSDSSIKSNIPLKELIKIIKP